MKKFHFLNKICEMRKKRQGGKLFVYIRSTNSLYRRFFDKKYLEENKLFQSL